MVAKIIVRVFEIESIVYSYLKKNHIDYFIVYGYSSIEMPRSRPFKGQDLIESLRSAV